jgi:NADPH:quinone reductase-like Zn-dependent oxidoreductase
MRLHGLDGPDSLRYEDVPDPEPGPGEVIVGLSHAALNRRDLFATRGQYPGAKPDALPVVLGSDGAGTVAAIGEGTNGPEEGAEVVVNPALYWGDDPDAPGGEYRILGLPGDGTFAALVKVPGENVFPKPAHLSPEEAAALPLAGLTAYRALFSRGGLKAGETVLVPGVGGGVATFLVQMAAAAGARVFVTSGSDGKLEAAKGLGAEGGVNYRSEGWSKELKGMAGPVDLSVDSVGGETFGALVSLARPGGRIVSFGATAGPVEKLVLPRIFLKHLTVLGTAMGTPEEFASMLRFCEEHGLRPEIDERFPLKEAAAALRHMEEGAGMGKIVLEITR